MEPLHMRIKKALTEKTQTNEIKKILLIDKNKASPLSTALQQEGYHLIHCDSVQKAWDIFIRTALISSSFTCMTLIMERVYRTFRNVRLWRKAFRLF